MKKAIILLTAFAVVFSLSACGKEAKTAIENAKAEKSAEAVTQAAETAAKKEKATDNAAVPEAPVTAENTTEPLNPPAFDQSGNGEWALCDETTKAFTTSIVGDPTKPRPTEFRPEEEAPSTYTGTTVVGTFVIKKVSGTYLEMMQLIYGSDLEKLIYCCDIGGLTVPGGIEYKAGDYITLRYDQEIAETYPLQLTVREILPNTWN